ncbi:hypothetical protein [Agreia sp. COWG]|nr:hypothetical protein [Agreia sp. COWG]CAD5990620.1 conserved protein of unknown function [Agreia sp. COWG]
MLLAIVFVSLFALVAAAGIVATVRAVATDGYRQIPTRGYTAR